jgi:hypothetical protein
MITSRENLVREFSRDDFDSSDFMLLGGGLGVVGWELRVVG